MLSSLQGFVCFKLMLFLHLILFIYFWPHLAGNWDLSSPRIIEPVPPAVTAQILNHWTARKSSTLQGF